MTLLLLGAGKQAVAGGGDPIGDALRADCVAYWTMNESSGARADATGNGHELSEIGSVNGVSGKITNAANLTVAQDNCLKRIGDSAFGTFGRVTVTIAGWLKFNDVTDPAGEDHTCYWLNAKDNFNFNTNQYILSYVDDLDVIYADFYNADGEEYAYIQHSTTVSLGEWYFVLMEINAEEQTVSISINGNKESSEFFAGTPESVIFASGFSLGSETALSGLTANYQMQGDIDEVGFWNRVLSTDEVSYLYNSGAGRTLYP